MRKSSLKRVFYVSPMSYKNLSLYDRALLTPLENINLKYFCNVKNEYNILEDNQIRLYSYSNKENVKKGLSYFVSQLKLLTYIIIYRPKIVHFQWVKIPELDYFVFKIIRLLGAKIVYTAHNVLPHDTEQKYIAIYKKLYSSVNVIITHTRTTNSEISQLLESKKPEIVTIPHGLLEIPSSSSMRAHDKEENLLKNLDLNNGVTFVFIGSLSKYKGLHLVVDAWKILSKKNIEGIHLIIAGKGENNKIKELEGEENVTLLNRFLSDSEFVDIIRKADYILLPYLRISQSGVLLTAMNERKKIIVSNKGGLTEPFKFGDVGFILENLTPEAIAETMLKAKDYGKENPNEETWEKIFNFYDWNEIASKTAKVYNNILK